MSLAKTVLRNVASSWVGLGAQIAITFILTPVILANLGLEIYGVWILLQGLVGYYGLVDMGLRAGITQSITRRIAEGDYAAVRLHIAASRPILMKLSIPILLVAFIVSYVLPQIITTTTNLEFAFTCVIMTQGVGVSCRVFLMPYSAILVGLQRYEIANTIAVFTRIGYAISACTLLQFGGGIVLLSIAMAVCNLIDSLLRVVTAYILVPELRGSIRGDRKAEVSELLRFGIWNFMIQIGRRVIYYSDTLVVGVLFSAAAIAPYGIAGAMVEYCNTLVKVSTRVLYPTIANLHAKGEKRQQRMLYLFSTRICLVISSAFLIIGYGHILPFLTLWLANAKGIDSILNQAPPLFLLIGIAFAFVSLRRPGMQLLLAAQKLKELAFIQIIEAMVNLALSLGLGWWIGITGVAWGTLIPAAALGLGWHLGAHAKILESTRTEILWSVVPRTLLFTSTLAGLVWLGYGQFGTIETWVHLISSLTVHVIVAGALLPLGLNSQERSAAYGILLRKIRGCFGSSVKMRAKRSKNR